MKFDEQEELEDYGGADAFSHDAGAAETGCHCLPRECCHCAVWREVLFSKIFSMI